MTFSTKLVIVLAAAAVPFLLSAVLTRKWRMPDYYLRVWLVLFCVLVSAAVVWVGGPPRLGIDLRGGVNLIYELEQGRQALDRSEQIKNDEAIAPETAQTQVNMDQLISAISKRINPGGQKEITIRKYGPGQIEIIIPEASDEEIDRVKRKVSSAGTLEFRITANEQDDPSLIERARLMPNTQDRLYTERKGDGSDPQLLAWWVPVEKDREEEFTEPTYVTRTVRQYGEDVKQVLVRSDVYNITGADLYRASQSFDEKGQPNVSFWLNSSGGQRFGLLTTEARPDPQSGFFRHLGIILDGRLYTAPRLQSAIFDHGQITGGFDMKKAQDLADVLNSGALPAALNDKPISELRTGPTLGKDTIEQGSNAMALSLALVCLFMIVYYRFSGLVASSAVLLNILITLALMILIKAPLTLPGLAGLALTVGMAVDANVLIYERIREELERGATVRMAIRNGFGRAQSAIVDSNLTTLISAIVLYAVGTEQIKGFAVTLTLGVAASLFTAVYCAHVVFDVAERQRWISKLGMMKLLDKTNYDFYGKRRFWYVVSTVVIVVGIAGVVGRVQSVGLLDIDFTGGVSVQVRFNEPQDIADVRAALAELPDLSVSDVQGSDVGANQGFLINTGSPPGVDAQEYLDEVKRTLNTAFGDKLQRNEMTIVWGGSDSKSKEPPATKPAGSAAPKPADQGRMGLPAIALAELAVAADAKSDAKEPDEKKADTPKTEAAKPEPAKAADKKETAKPAAEKAEAKPEAKPEAMPEAKPQAKPEAKAAAKPAEVQATLTFQRKLDHESVEDLIRAQLDKGTFGSKDVEIRVFNESFREGSSEAYTQWQVALDMPRDRAEALLQAVAQDLHKSPYFPTANTIGGRVAASSRTQALYAIIVANVLIAAYLWVRFQSLMYGVAAVVALVHDVLVALGALALSYWLAPFLGFLMVDPFKIGLTEVAAFLTLVGFSTNDTVVIFDRIREVKGKSPYLTPEMVNLSINQTLSRTFLTSLTVLMVVLVLYILGGSTIHGFSYAMLLGSISGVYSSVFIAAPLLFFGKHGAKADVKKGAAAPAA